MEDQSIPPVGIDQPVFRPTPKPNDTGTGQPLAKPIRQSAPQVRTQRLHPRDSVPVEHARKSADGRLDFGKLRHPADMADQPQAR